MSDVNAEKAVLGYMMLDTLAISDAMAILHHSDFSLASHQDLFREMAEMSKAGIAIDVVTLSSHMGHAKVQGVGGLAYIFSLSEGLPRQMNITSHAKKVYARSMARKGVLACQNTQQRLLDPAEDVFEVLDDLSRILIHERTEDTMTAEEVIPEALRSMDGDFSEVIPTGIREIDEMTSGGMRAKELWIIGAQPSGGKSSLCRQFERSALKNDFGVHSHSVEVPKEDWVRFHIAREAGIAVWKLRKPWLMSAVEKEYMRAAAVKVAQWNHFIDDAGSVHINTLLAKSRLSCMRHGVKLFTVDYLQMLQGTGKDMRLIMGNIARSLKQFAKDNNVCVVALSQLTRQGDINARPTVQHLKESGDLEAAADVVLLNYRPKDLENDRYTGEDLIVVAKQRNGSVGAVPMTYNSDNLCFESRN